MKASEVRDLTPDQLDDELVKLKKEQFNLRFQKATGQLENTRGFARSAATSRVSRRSRVRSRPKPQSHRTGQMPKRILQGVVVSDANDKTVVVRVERDLPILFYKKTVRKTKKYHAHDAENAAKTGDMVRIQECAPISKNKRWTLIEDAVT